METITSDQGTVYDIVVEMWPSLSLWNYPTGRVYLQKFSQSREEKEESTKCDHSFDTALLRNPPIYVCSKCGLQGTWYNASCVWNGKWGVIAEDEIEKNVEAGRREGKYDVIGWGLYRNWVRIGTPIESDDQYKKRRRAEISSEKRYFVIYSILTLIGRAVVWVLVYFLLTINL